jgi:molybdate transport system regulatory protein
VPDNRISVRLDLVNGDRIGPGKIALLEAIQDTGSISAAARRLGMSYRRAWLLIEETNKALRKPAVAKATGGAQGGGAAVTPVGRQIITLYREIERSIFLSSGEKLRTLDKLARR